MTWPVGMATSPVPARRADWFLCVSAVESGVSNTLLKPVYLHSLLWIVYILHVALSTWEIRVKNKIWENVSQVMAWRIDDMVTELVRIFIFYFFIFWKVCFLLHLRTILALSQFRKVIDIHTSLITSRRKNAWQTIYIYFFRVFIYTPVVYVNVKWI